MFLSSLLDLLFPPLCLACGVRGKSKYLCLPCWELCALPDPVDCCRSCFAELDHRGNLCAECRRLPVIPAFRAFVFAPESPARLLDHDCLNAMAGFAFLQWVRLEWDQPFAIIPMPDKDSRAIGKSLADLMNVPFVRALDAHCRYKEGRLEEDQPLLLFDVSNSVSDLKKAALSLAESFPKRVYLLSLLPYVDFDS